MSEREIIRTLSSDDVARRIALLCKDGQNVDSIVGSIIAYYRRKGFSNDVETIRGRTASRIASLERIKAIEFREGKWYTSEVAKTILEKYLGI